MRPTRKYKTALTVALSLFLSSGALFSQIEQREFKERYRTAVELYHSKIFEGSQLQFEELLKSPFAEERENLYNIKGYLTLIAIESKRPNIDALYLEMVKNFGEAPLLNHINFKYGENLFERELYREAIEIFTKVHYRELAKRDRNCYNFKKGYSHFRVGDNQRALDHFLEVEKSPYDSYTNPSRFYLSHIYYSSREFSKAINSLELTKSDPRFSLLSRYYLLESHFMLKDYNFVTEQGELLYSTLPQDLQGRASRIISEAFYAKGETERAEYYFKRYSSSNLNLTRSDLYYAAILSYAQSNWDEAIELFKQVLSKDDSLSQNSAYHLAQCYIIVKNKIEALKSFELAAESNFDKMIQEDAMFNQAKLSFDLHSDLSIFKRYLSLYSPDQKKHNEIQSYIASSYLLNKNYKLAIEALKEIKNPTKRDLLNLQKASFLRGMQLLDISAYREAIPNFRLAIESGEYNSSLYNASLFWLAEALYRDNQIRNSLEISLELANNPTFRESGEWSTNLYNLGYSYFKLANFSQAENWFKRFIRESQRGESYLDEANARLGDCLFMQRRYRESIEPYSKVSSSKEELKHYSLFQIAMAKGLIGEERAKAQGLKELTSGKLSNILEPEVLYELGRTLIQIGEDREAESYLRRLSEKYFNSTYHPKALLELGLIHLNRGENHKAIALYKEIIEESPQSPEVESAVAGLESSYQNIGEGKQFLAYIDKIGMSESKSVDDRELILFTSAEKLFLSKNWTATIGSLTTLLKEYPDGAKAAHGWFYLGESYREIGKYELSLDAFLKVMQIGEGSFTELATLNYARISFQLENYKEAIKGYSSLSRVAKLENNQLEAKVGLLHSYYHNREYKNSIAQAHLLLSQEISKEERLKTTYLLAKSHLYLGERESAFNYFREISANKVTPEGAESSYLIISDAFDKGDFAKVEEEVYKFADSNTPHTYWLAKSFILLGDTFAERDNFAQAEATYRSILDSYPENEEDDIMEQINIRLSKIEEKRADENR